MSATLAAPITGPALVAMVTPAAQHHQAAELFPITVNSVTNVSGTLIANASIGNMPLQIPLTLSVASAATGATGSASPHASTTPILDLTLQPIHVDLLGLTVDTSEIRLQISAQSGPGNLLGNLLTDVSNLLNGGTSLSSILSGLTGSQLSTLTTGLTSLLNGTLSQLTTPAAARTGASVTSSGTTNILDLSVGPLNLNLLGLNVVLDNGSGGPVTVDISAQSGPGDLLGNLLGDLSHLLDRNVGAGAITGELNRIANQITSLVNQPSLLPITINSVSTANGGLVANASLGGTSFQIPLSLDLDSTTTAATPILDLTLQPIHLDLLGLTVDTSEIRLEITAQSGPGNLLGNLLTDVANLLNSGSSLSSILSGLTGDQLTTLTTGLTNLLNETLGILTAPASTAASVSTTNSRTSEILNLSVGPLNLNLLGLNVVLDNGSGGPVTVDIGTHQGPGNLLGNLLGNLTSVLDSNASLGAITNSLNRIANQITSLVNQPSLLPITINSISTANGSLVANASLGGTSFQIPLSLGLDGTTAAMGATSPQAATPILDLTLQPIHLNLLGLTVDTSEIRLQIIAQSGPGNLLGNLLTDVANLLNGGTSLSSILSGLTGSQLTTLTTGLTNLLNEGFGILTAPATVAGGGASVTSSGTTNILHLSVGPLDLNLLGLNVVLDNGSGGPVTVDIGAQSGPGNLLGNLLGSLAHVLDHGRPTGALANALDRIAADVTALL